MSLARKFLLLTVTVVMLSASHVVKAELYEHKPMLPDCCEADCNFAWFEPIYCDCAEEPPYSTGVFFQFEQLFVSASRAEEAPGGTEFGDSTNGSRYDFGYMYEKTGWNCSVLKINNPGVRLTDTNVARAPIIDGDPVVDDEIFVNLALNAIGDEFQTLNSFNIYGVELNHLWRMEPTYRGFLLEPFLGLRYMRFRDHFDQGVFEQEAFDIPAIGPPGATVAFVDATDLYSLDETTTDNDMFGGQFGIRVGRRHGRWNYSSEFRGFTFHNFVTRNRKVQTLLHEEIVNVTYNDAGVAESATVVGVNGTTGVTETDSTEGVFAFGGEWRGGLSFHITKMFEVLVGGEVLVFGDGIARGQIRTDEPFVLGGVSLGFAINR